ncbi:MAG: dicarboxylate/amino acid:cation symporter [Betaproteobacteria bacterium]|nr:dicarboxylate/amino acid:cation symporter [Betaproteobacteria bacterium]MCL2887407.1 dicarboxylate/amino acid:cation symporter [Betaproteobacteria bacterium]
MLPNVVADNVASSCPPSAPARKRWYRVLYIQVLIAIVIGVLLGWLMPDLGQSMKPLGDGFIKLVKMIIAPVIFLTVVTGIAGMSNLGAVGRIAGKAMVYFLCWSTLALVVGLIIANVVQPGAGMHIDPASLDASQVSGYVKKAHDATITAFILNIIPETLVSPLTTGNVLQVLFVAILFGISISLAGEHGRPVLNFLEALSTPVFKAVGMLMRAAPVGAFGAMAYTIGAYGIQSISNLAILVATFYLTSLFFVLVILGAVARYNGFSILKLIRLIKDELLLVLGTSSSESALPALMQKMQRAGCAKPVVGLVVPMGYSFNLDGTNIYMTLAALFIAQALNIELSLGHQLMLLLVAMLSSKGAAGVTGAGFITLAATLTVLPGLPVEGMVLVLGVDRFMSECRSLTNFTGNAVAAIVVSRWDKQLDQQRLHAVLDNPALLDQPEVIDEPANTPVLLDDPKPMVNPA